MATEDAKNTPSQEQMPDKGRRDTIEDIGYSAYLRCFGIWRLPKKGKTALRGPITYHDVFR